MSQPIVSALHAIKYNHNVEVAEMAKWADVSESKMYQVMAEERVLSMTEVRRLALELGRRGVHLLSEQFIAPSVALVPLGTSDVNGSITDEVLEMSKAMGRIIEAFQSRNRSEFDAAWSLLALQVENLKAEGGTL
jgi:hypothetical protein